MVGWKKSLLIIGITLLVSCASSTRFLGTNQPGIAVNACAAYRAECTIFHSGLSINGRQTVLSGTYRLQAIETGGYQLFGNASLSIDNAAMEDIRFLDLTFVLLQGDLVVYEEKIRLEGDFAESIEFTRTLDTAVTYDSSNWAWFNWRA